VQKKETNKKRRKDLELTKKKKPMKKTIDFVS
jgi:hypothetical protein